MKRPEYWFWPAGGLVMILVTRDWRWALGCFIAVVLVNYYVMTSKGGIQ
jgi:hypothetical protein